VKNKLKNLEKIEEIQVEDFINNVLPTAKEIEVYLDNKHINNMVSLIAPKKGDCQTMFKWDNNFSWAYTGNITDLNIKSNVNKAGGKVDGILRFSIQWNDEDIHNQSDYDAHCIEPKGNHIFYSRRNNDKTSGKLDIDILEPEKNVPAVENITWTNKQKMEKGMYKFWVHNYNKKKGDSGFRAEIEFNGEKYFFNYQHELKDKEDIHVADVEFDGENFKINKKLKTETQNKSIWNLKTNQFVPVSVIMYSPNYWNEQQGIGNKHYMFMLKDCKNDENPNGFFNEYLNNKLIPHRKVMECLSNKMKVEYMDNQLSGVGFSSTKRNEVIVKVKGYTERILKIKI